MQIADIINKAVFTQVLPSGARLRLTIALARLVSGAGVHHEVLVRGPREPLFRSFNRWERKTLLQGIEVTRFDELVDASYAFAEIVSCLKGWKACTGHQFEVPSHLYRVPDSALDMPIRPADGWNETASDCALRTGFGQLATMSVGPVHGGGHAVWLRVHPYYPEPVAVFVGTYARCEALCDMIYTALLQDGYEDSAITASPAGVVQAGAA